MKKLSLLLVLILCLSLCACGQADVEEIPAARDVQIKAGRIEAGMIPRDIFVEVTIDGQPVACEVELTCFTETGYYVMAADEAVPENFYGRLDVYYSLPEGVDLDSAEVTMTCDGGEYDGTGSVGNDANGCVEAWSHAIYGTEPVQPSFADVQIKAGKIETGMTPKDISVEVTINGQAAACKVELTCFTDTGYYVMAADEAVPENFYGRLDVYYSLPEGVDLDSAEVTMTCDGGEYDGTGSVGNDANGCVEAWSHAIYGTEPAATEPVHTHDWNKDESKSGIVGCNFDGYTVYVCDCGESYRKTIPALGHDYAEPSITPPTCTRTGYQTTHCKRCGEGLFSEIPATGHSWSQWTYENGRVHVRTCSVCGEREEANHSIPSGTVTCTDCGMDIVN